MTKLKTVQRNFNLNIFQLIWGIAFSCFFITVQAQNPTNSSSQNMISQENVLVKLIDLKQNGDKLTMTFGTFGKKSEKLEPYNGMLESGNDHAEGEINFVNGQATHSFSPSTKGDLILVDGKNGTKMYHAALKNDNSVRFRNIPLWLSVIPPLLAILFALIFREVVVSLFIGVWAGAFIAGGLRIESIYYFLLSFLEVVQKYVINALADSGHLSVIIFSLLVGGMVAIISRNGGMAGVVKSLSRYAKSPRSAQFITWLLGVAIFFDDYANTLIVGNTMRSVTDKFKISREKLAYIVDSTAAPVSAVAFITTWIGAELGYIDDGISQIEVFAGQYTPYAIFLSSLKYSFYPIFTLIFILFIIYTKKDFGEMRKAELRARTTGEVSRPKTGGHQEEVEDLSPVEGAPLKWYNAAIPVLVVIFMTLFGLVDTGMASLYSDLIDKGTAVASQGWGDTWSAVGLAYADDTFLMKVGKLIGASDSYVALLWASLSGVMVAIFLTLIGRIMSLPQTMSALTSGFKAMLPALLILTFAWALAITTEELHTATFLTGALEDSISPYLMPGITFVLAAVIAFSTGSSWSTMAILYPIVIPTTWAICSAQGLDPEAGMEILLNVISVTLAASVLGDHCSPISDTTILSSLASDCNHIDHVRTQMPYALTVGAVSLTCAILSSYLGGGGLVCFTLFLAGLAVLWTVVWKFGKTVEE